MIRPLVLAAPAVLVSLVGCADSPTDPLEAPVAPGAVAASATAVTVNQKMPVDFVQFVPCADDGAGENVHVEGMLHAVTRLTVDATGGFHLRMHTNAQGTRGVGQTTGDVYRATGRTGGTSYEASGGLPAVVTAGNTFRLTAPGKENDLIIHNTVHLTVDANGVVRADVSNERMECR